MPLTKEQENQQRIGYINTIQKDLLFAVQGVGQEKEVNSVKLFVKHDHCEASLQDIYRKVKSDSTFEPHVKQTLYEWRFIQEYLMPVLIFHKQDKKLAMLVVALLVELTEYPTTKE